MATYLELLSAANNDTVRQKVRVACIIAAETVRGELTSVANHTARMAWAKAVFDNPEAMGNKMLWAVLAQNKSATLAAIQGASDTAVQNNVDAAIDLFAV